MKIKENFDYLLDESIPLLPQLTAIKKGCFRPYLTSDQLIKFFCEPCLEQGKCDHCDFFEATHLSVFSTHLQRILNDPTIPEPPAMYPQAERLCHGRTTLKEILISSYKLYKIDLQEPTWVETPEHREWKRKRKLIFSKLPCATCAMNSWCNFFKNGVNETLTFSDIAGTDENGGIIWEPYVEDKKYYRGYITSSYLFRKFILGQDNQNPLKEKDCSVIRTEEAYRKLLDWQYKIYSKIFEAVKDRPDRTKIEVLKYAVYLLLSEGDEGDLLTTYLLGNASEFKEKNIYKLLDIYKLKTFDIGAALKKLASFGLCGDLDLTCDFQKVRRLAQQNKELFSEDCAKVLQIDVLMLLEYASRRRLSILDIFYEYFLSGEKTPSREDIKRHFKISRNTQVDIEKRLCVRKDFRNIGTVQLSNSYLTNTCLLSNIFTVLSRVKAQERLKEVAKKNKALAHHKKIYTRKGKPKLKPKQLLLLDELHKELVDAHQKNTTECDIIVVTGKN